VRRAIHHLELADHLLTYIAPAGAEEEGRHRGVAVEVHIRRHYELAGHVDQGAEQVEYERDPPGSVETAALTCGAACSCTTLNSTEPAWSVEGLTRGEMVDANVEAGGRASSVRYGPA